jgi:hypothetical protein
LPQPASERPAPSGPWRQSEWQRFWLATQSRQWLSLALVPAGDALPHGLILHAAVALARTGMLHLGTQIHVADAGNLRLDLVTEFASELEDTMQSGLVIVALPSVDASPITVPLARAADSAMMCVALQGSRLADIRRALDQIGKEHFLGAATFG